MSSASELRCTVLLSASFLLSSLLYAAICVNVPITLIPAGIHDDGLYIGHAESIASGHWLGAFSQFTLMKGSGYSIFLALLSICRFPAVLGQALFYSVAVGLLSILTLKLFRSYLLSFVVFEAMLWNFGPDANRMIREDIYHSEFLVAFSLLSFTLLYPNRFRTLLTILSGTFFGWLWITREEGVIAIPAFVLLFSYAAYRNHCTHGSQRSLVILSLIFIASSAALPTAVSIVNRIVYGEFETVDIKGDFEGALEALESIRPDHRVDFLSVSRDVREKAYKVSPTFGRLRKFFDSPGVPYILRWEAPGCQVFPKTCGDYAFGWFMWAFRDAAALDGDYANAPTSAQLLPQDSR